MRGKEILRQSYDQHAREYAESITMQSGNLRHLLEYFSEATTHGSGDLPIGQYLDVGCGSGILAKELSQQLGRAQSYEYVGIDISSKIVELARELYGDLGSFVVGDAEQLPFEDGRFNFVLSNSVLHWLNVPTENRTPRKAISEIARVLGSGGIMGMSVAADGTARRFQQAYRRVIEAKKDCPGFDPTAYRDDPIGSMHLCDLVDDTLAVGLEVLSAKMLYEPVVYQSALRYVFDVRAYGYGPYMAALDENEREEAWEDIGRSFVESVGSGVYVHDQYMNYVIARKR